MCNCRLCNMSEEDDLKGATLCYMVEKLDLSHDQAEKSYALVDEVASVAASSIGSLREVVANVIAVNIDLLPQNNDQCASLLGYLAEVYSYSKKQYEENHKPKCNHLYPDENSAIEYCSLVEMHSWDMYCKICGKHRTLEELERDSSVVIGTGDAQKDIQLLVSKGMTEESAKRVVKRGDYARYLKEA